MAGDAHVLMSMKLMMVKVAALAAMTLSVVAGEGWHTNFEEAKALAKKENKDLLLEFTGSDWCPPCIMLAKNVFDKPEFAASAKKDFVLVKLDYPRKKALPAAEKKQNDALSARYGIQAFPTVLLADADGVPYAAAGREQTPDAYVKMLQETMPAKEKLQTALTEARKLEGSDKARALEAALKASEGLKPSLAHEEILKEILAADPESGMASEIMVKAELSAVSTKEEAAEVFKKYDAYVAKTGSKGAAKQQLMLAKLDVLYKVKDWDGMRGLVDEIVAEDPESQIGKGIMGVKPRIDMMEKEAMNKAKTKE